MRRLLLVGLNHSTAPLHLREMVAFSREQARHALLALRARFPDAEFVLLSTCNRIELYVARETHSHPRTEELTAFLAEFHSLPSHILRRHLYEKREREAIEHLFTVASSLDSMVVGETQILGQVRSAYQLAQEAQTVRSMLNPLFQRAIAVGKQVMHKTTLGDGRLSIASIAVEHARTMFDRFDNKTLLCVGTGKMAQLVLQHFIELKPQRKLISSHDPLRAESIAAQFSGEPVPMCQLPAYVPAADIIISATGAGRPILTRRTCERALSQRQRKPLFICDLAVPRDVEPDVTQIDGVRLHNIDDLQQAASTSMSNRRDAIESAQAIVTSQVEEFLAWNLSREMGPVIEQLYKRYHAIAQEELARTLAKLPHIGDGERAHFEDLSRRIANKLSHDPIRAMKNLHHLPGWHAPDPKALAEIFHIMQPTIEA